MRKAWPLVALALALGSSLAFTEGDERIESVPGAKGSKELVYRGENLVEERSYDERGALVEERSFDSTSLPVETRSYIRVEGRLTRVEARDFSGIVSGSKSYHYDSKGRLLGVSSEGSFGEGVAGMIAARSVPQGSWTVGDKTVVLAYDELGRAVLSQTMKEGAALAIERKVFGESGLLESLTLEDKRSGLVQETQYDEKGRPESRIDIPALGPKEMREYGYDDSGRLVEERRSKAGHKTKIVKSYGEEGSLIREETSQDGELILVVSYDKDSRVEELYEEGEPFVRASYSGGRKVKDEFLSDGIVVRAREYQ